MSAAMPRDGEPYIDEHGETWRGVPWLVGAFQILAILGFGGVLAYVVVGHWTSQHWLVAVVAALAAVVVALVRMGRG